MAGEYERDLLPKSEGSDQCSGKQWGVIATCLFHLGIYGLVTVSNRETFLGSQGREFNQKFAIDRSTVFTTFVAYLNPLKIMVSPYIT